jgi:phosphate/phosphite/phosphonate ABC transporter binding protein
VVHPGINCRIFFNDQVKSLTIAVHVFFAVGPLIRNPDRTFKTSTQKKELGFMTRHLPMRLIALAIFWSFLAGVGSAAETPKPLRIAILPCNNIEITFRKFYPLLRYLKQQTNLDIRLVVPGDFTQFEISLKNGETDFALQDPHTYITSANLYNKDELLRTLSMDGGTTHSAVVVVRQDSHIKTLNDLRGKTVMFGPKSSSSKWVAARLLFEENGLNINKDLKAYSHGGCCEDIAFSVYMKSVDAGVVCDHFLAEHEEKQLELGVEGVKIQVIGRTKPVPNRVLSPRKDVSEDIVSKINNALLKLDRKNPEHAKILYRAELGRFQRAYNNDYDSLRGQLTSNLRD